MTQLVVFDFDGTIADSFGIILAAFEELVPQKKKLTQEDVQFLRNKPYRELLKHFGVSWVKVPGLVIKGKSMLTKSIETVQPFRGMPEALKQLHELGFSMAIISSNSTVNINKFLNKHDLRECFQHVQGNISLLGKTKAINAMMKRTSSAANEVLYVGDEPRDIDAAHKARVKCIAVTWGFIGEPVLKTHNPARLVDTPKELVQAVRTV